MADQEHKEDQEHREEQEPLPAADLRPLKELAQEYPLSYHSLRHYAKIGRLRGMATIRAKLGNSSRITATGASYGRAGFEEIMR